MDSLMGAEIKQTLERGYDVVLGVQEIRALTFAKLRVLAGGEAGGAEPGAEAEAGARAEAEAVAEAETPERTAGAEHAANAGDLVQFAALEELVPEEVLVKLPSAASDDPNIKPVFMVSLLHGIFVFERNRGHRPVV